MKEIFTYLSMLSPRGGGGGGGEAALTVRSVPGVGNLTWPPCWIIKKTWKSTLCRRLFPPQVVGERPWQRGCLKITPRSWKIPRRRSNELPTFVRGG